MPFLSIVIPAKNEEANLPRLLTSVKEQTFKDYEIIVADAESKDKTTEVAESFGAKVVPGGLPGPGRNRGAAAASGHVILFLDSDVVLVSPKFLEDNLTEMKKKGACVATAKVKPLTRNPIDRALHEVYNAYAIATERMMPHAPGFCIFVKKHIHEEIGGFDEAVVFAEDHDYVQRAEKAGYRFRILRSHPIAVSVRRLEKDGRLAIAIKYTLAELRMMGGGSFKEMPKGGYEMGGDVYAVAGEKEQKKNSS
ncbi:MAG: glycosyltransferase [Patescibacteria group bacterium]|nr:glycosyltransferase [Patescibacteria group bacterium]